MSRVLYRLRAPPQIAALVGGLYPQIKKKVGSALALILANPLSGKALKDELDGLRSFRVGRIRIVYRIASGRASAFTDRDISMRRNVARGHALMEWTPPSTSTAS